MRREDWTRWLDWYLDPAPGPDPTTTEGDPMRIGTDEKSQSFAGLFLECQREKWRDEGVLPDDEPTTRPAPGVGEPEWEDFARSFLDQLRADESAVRCGAPPIVRIYDEFCADLIERRREAGSDGGV